VASRKRTRLLIADDDKPIRTLLATVARRAGFTVDVAKDGVEALSMLERTAYDIVIVDLMMPQLSGYDLIQRISSFNPRPVIIVATALTNGDVSSLDDSLVRRVIRKPFDVQTVANALIQTAVEIAGEWEAEPPPPAPTLHVSEKQPATDPVEDAAAVEEKPVAPPKDELPPKEKS
jgi:DNA-binding response OmpR family regulator